MMDIMLQLHYGICIMIFQNLLDMKWYYIQFLLKDPNKYPWNIFYKHNKHLYKDVI